MASFKNRGSKQKPSWQYTISRMVNGKSKPIRKGGFRTKKEAEAAAAEVESDLRKGVVPHLTPEPFDNYFEQWVEAYKAHVNKNTYERYLNTLETIREYFGSKPIQEIKNRDYQVFLNEYGASRAKSTSNKLNSHVRACVRQAIDDGIIRVDFTRNANTTGKKGKRSEDKHLNFKDSARLYEYLRNNLDNGLSYYLLLLGLVTGMRFGELAGLTRKDFNFMHNTIKIDKTWGYTNKMHKGFGPTKNEQSIREITVDKKVMKDFEKLFDDKVVNINQLVFFSSQSKYKVITNVAANKVLKGVLKRLGINTISMHGLRHTHASVLLYRKATIYYVSERLGHNDIATTNNEYSHVLKEMRKEDENIAVNIYV